MRNWPQEEKFETTDALHALAIANWMNGAA
jgi:hypothetical protein